VSRGAVAEVRGNDISGNFYTGHVGVGPNPGGQNHFSDNQHNFANVP